jgi:hypothetical protein
LIINLRNYNNKNKIITFQRRWSQKTKIENQKPLVSPSFFIFMIFYFAVEIRREFLQFTKLGKKILIFRWFDYWIIKYLKFKRLRFNGTSENSISLLTCYTDWLFLVIESRLNLKYEKKLQFFNHYFDRL